MTSESAQKELWLNRPAEDEWALDTPAPNKAEFISWLERELEISNFATQVGLWKHIMFCSAWLVRDERKRPSNREFRDRIEKLEKHIHAIESVLRANEDTNHIDGWLKHSMITAQIDMRMPNAINSIDGNLTLLRALLNRNREYLDQRSSGPRRDDVLWDWVDAISMHIEIFTDLPIKVDFQGGDPVTPYARLVFKTVEMLDPSRLPQVQNVLTRYRTERNRSQKSAE